jgi:hypothetical protein
MKIMLRCVLPLLAALASALVGEPGAFASSAGRPYTLSPPPSIDYPDSGGELTNGVTDTGESWVNAAGWPDTDPTITVDLGQAYNLTGVQLYVGNSFGNGSFGVFRPASVAVLASNDGVSFTPIGSLAFSPFSDVGTKNQVDRGSATVSGTARWIRFAIARGEPSAWVMVTELVVTTSFVPYTLSPPPSIDYPDSGGELINGVTATGESWGNAAGWLGVNPTITWDLGRVYNLHEVQLFVGNSFGTGQFGVYRPASVSVSVSSDGVSFTPVGNLSFSAYSSIGTKEQVDLGRLPLSASGRWIRYSVVAGGPWVMVTEMAASAGF